VQRLLRGVLLCYIQGRGVLDLPLSWVEPDLRRHVKREATKLSKLWRCVALHPVHVVLLCCINAPM
jgi:hypothetical protein